MKKILKISFSLMLLAIAIVFIGCEGKSMNDGSEYLADHPYDSLDRPDWTGETAYDLQIIPSKITIPLRGDFQLSVTGGAEPYGDWVVTIPDLGSVSSSGKYTAGRHNTGENTVSITDASGKTVSMTVIVSSGIESYPLRIIPENITIPSSESFQLYVTGGRPPYGDWMVTIPALGSVSSSGRYTSSSATGTNIVSITDASGKTVSMTVVVQ